MNNPITYDEVFDAQQHYRLILDSMARPGKINVIPPVEIDEPMDINNASALIAFALLNTDASFFAMEGDDVANFISLNTSAVNADLADADLVFISGLHEAEFIPQLKVGTLSYPENSATIIADVNRISNEKINGPQYFATERSTDVQIVGLRKKLGAYKDAIETVRSVGYRFNSAKFSSPS